MEIKEETPEEAQELADSGGELVEPPPPAPLQEQDSSCTTTSYGGNCFLFPMARLKVAMAISELLSSISSSPQFL